MSEESNDFVRGVLAMENIHQLHGNYLKSPDTDLCAKILAEEFSIEKHKLAAIYLIENEYTSDSLKRYIFRKLASDFPETFLTYPMKTITSLITVAETQMVTETDPLPAFILEFFRHPYSLLPYPHTSSKETE